MKKRAPVVHFLAGLLHGLSWLVCLAFLVMWPFSYRFYTSFGIDTDQVDGGSVVRTFYRLRWPGDGSFWMGAEAFRPPASEPLDAFDLGGAFFRAPRKPEPRSSWNRRGFWFIREQRKDTTLQAQSGTHVWSFWMGVPSWLPPLLTGLLPVLPWIRKRRLAGSAVR
jgi:hypothetical protein